MWSGHEKSANAGHDGADADARDGYMNRTHIVLIALALGLICTEIGPIAQSFSHLLAQRQDAIEWAAEREEIRRRVWADEPATKKLMKHQAPTAKEAQHGHLVFSKAKGINAKPSERTQADAKSTPVKNPHFVPIYPPPTEAELERRGLLAPKNSKGTKRPKTPKKGMNDEADQKLPERAQNASESIRRYREMVDNLLN